MKTLYPAIQAILQNSGILLQNPWLEKEASSEIQVQKVGSNTFTSSGQLAEIMNSHISNAGKNLAKSVPKTTQSYMHFLKYRISNSIALTDTDSEEVSSIVLSLDSNKSGGPDEIPIKIIKLLNGLITPI